MLAVIGFGSYTWLSPATPDIAVVARPVAPALALEKPKPAAMATATPPMKSGAVLALIRSAAVKHRVPEAFIKSIVAAESHFDSTAVSPVGAIGLMQVMPKTAHEFGANPAIPSQNVDAGTRYLRFLIEKYRKNRNPLPRVIAAYNAGPGAVDRYRGVPPFRETRQYVVRVLAFLKHFKKQHPKHCLESCNIARRRSDWRH
jgi:hypothetical protein